MVLAAAQPHPIHLKYRADIDGLRAIAVLSVVGFHAFPNWVRGGFVGVDIFFVISGYLITTILLGSLAGDTFSYREFYTRRIRRIFPALILVMSATFAFGWFSLLQNEFSQLGKHVAAGAAFVSNFAFWSESGYFDAAAETKPLLHLWSLAVEEQFYIVWPLLLALAWRSGRHVLAVMVSIALVSFVLNVALVHPRAAAAFYLPVSRFWELIAGGLLAYLRLHRPHALPRGADLQAGAGLALITAALLLLNKGKAFPGWWALLPVLGALLCISAGPGAWINRHLLGSKPMVWFGLISYPLYLWHWPLLVYARILEGDTPSRNIRVAAMLVSIGLAWLTYRFVERRARRNAHPATPHALGFCMAALGIVGVLAATGSLHSRHTDPLIGRVMAALSDWSYPSGLQAQQQNGEPIYRVGQGKHRVLMFGDSHIEQYGARAVELAQTSQGTTNTILFATSGGCPPIPQVFEDRNPVCAARRSEFIRLAQSDRIDSIVVGGCWNCYFIDQARPDATGAARDAFYFLEGNSRHGYRTGDGVERSLQSLEAMLADFAGRKKTYLLLDNPVGPEFGPEHLITGSRLGQMSAARITPTAPQPEAQMRLHARLRSIAARTGVAVIDPLPSLCRDGHCTRATADGDPIYKDRDHLRSDYVRKFATYLDEALVTPK